VDEPTETILEKGWQDGQGSLENFPVGRISGVVAGATPFSWGRFNTGILKYGNKMYFRGGSNTSFSSSPTAYDPGASSYNENTTYQVNVRVKVCVAGMLESNCVPYSQGHKPEGLIQENSANTRYAAFGYLGDGSAIGSDNDINVRLDGGVMRSRMKFVGPEEVDPDTGLQVNAQAEWNETTGVFIPNPSTEDASATETATSQTVEHSGVISFINRSGQNFPEARFKRRDNVSELYYAATRYFRNLGNVPQYSNIDAAVSGIPNLESTTVATKRKQLVDGLPVITDWGDPVQYACQPNFILGIGDTNTAFDLNLPGGGNGSTEPTRPAAVTSDDIDVEFLADKLFGIEGVNRGGVFGAGRSPYIASLAYHAHAADIRDGEDDFEGKQSISTYWIDIIEFGDFKSRANNQYWLAAKYGGFEVPEGFDIDTYDGSPFPENWWYTSGDPDLPSGDKRPDNFYSVSNAQEMRSSLRQAFTDIQEEQTGNRSSLALNSTTLDAGSATFQAQYTSGIWTGDLNAFTLDEDTGALSVAPAWTASSKLPAPASRNIKTWNGSALVNFTTDAGGINNGTLTGLLKTDSGTGASFDETDIVNYLRGVRTDENDATGLRERQGVLGDIVNSQPVFVGNPPANVFRGQSFAGSDTYRTYAENLSRTPTVYVGSNDGMLHGFNATTGETNSGVETFAYVPRTVIQNGLGELANSAYNHRYFVDGELTVADAFDGSNWRTILVGTLGAGGVAKDRSDTNNAIFALDITDPTNVTFLWERNSTNIPELGVNQGKPVIAQIADGNWSVLLGNGPNSDGGRAQLVSIGLFNGTVKATAMSNDADNGLSAVRAWDNDGNGLTDTVYAGDLQGNLWKVTNLARITPTVQKLFQAVDASGDAQPITASPLAGRSPFTQRVWLFFGTGKYLSTGDLSDTSTQTWYGLNDDGSTATVSRSDDLLERKILQDVVRPSGVTARVIEAGTREDLVGKRGWYIDLLPNGVGPGVGERMVTPNQFQGSALIGNSRIPDASDPCAPSGRGFILSIDPFTGARLVQTFFDINGDGEFNDGDLININGELVVVSGLGLNTGFSNPSFLGENMYIPTDDGEISTLDINPFTTGASRTSWRELLNTGN
jgi:type IV pilus assembly protein PilY1